MEYQIGTRANCGNNAEPLLQLSLNCIKPICCGKIFFGTHVWWHMTNEVHLRSAQILRSTSIDNPIQRINETPSKIHVQLIIYYYVLSVSLRAEIVHVWYMRNIKLVVNIFNNVSLIRTMHEYFRSTLTKNDSNR